SQFKRGPGGTRQSPHGAGQRSRNLRRGFPAQSLDARGERQAGIQRRAAATLRNSKRPSAALAGGAAAALRSSRRSALWGAATGALAAGHRSAAAICFATL